MILVIAVAVGLAMARYPLGFFDIRARPLVTTVQTGASPVAGSISVQINQVIRRVVRASAYAYPSILTLTVAALVIRFIPPRPRVRSVLRQPGALGCAVAVFGFLLVFLVKTPEILSLRGTVMLDWRHYFNLSLTCSRMTGIAVASAWLALAFAGRWRPERTWVDWFGQVLAGSWIVAIVLELAAVWTSLL
jgi:hypothetical protein